LGFCLEYGRGPEQEIELAGEYDKMASDRDHPEVIFNDRRGLRRLGRWNASERPSYLFSRRVFIDRLLKSVQIRLGET
jgi:hypothetical protein